MPACCTRVGDAGYLVRRPKSKHRPYATTVTRHAHTAPHVTCLTRARARLQVAAPTRDPSTVLGHTCACARARPAYSIVSPRPSIELGNSIQGGNQKRKKEKLQGGVYIYCAIRVRARFFWIRELAIIVTYVRLFLFFFTNYYTTSIYSW